MAAKNIDSIEQVDQKSHEPRRAPVVHHGARKLVLAAVLICMASFAAVQPASASFSPFVNVKWANFAAPAGDCTARVGAHYRTDGMAQGEASVACNLRHARTVTYVRLVRWNGSMWVGLPWSGYTFNNSYGTGTAHIVTQPSGTCGYTAWYSEVYATVTTGATNNVRNFPNDYQYYDPCA